MAFSRSNVPTYASFSDLVGNGRRFRVPRFQRDYKWTAENWEELWGDILELEKKPAEEHFLGPIVTRQAGADAAEIVDGQQRIATLSLLTLAAVSLLEEYSSTDSKNHERAEDIRRAFVSSKDPLSLHYSSKLTLNRADDDFYQHTLVQLRQPHAPSRLSESNSQLWKAFEFFKSRLREKFSTPDAGGHLAVFVQSIVGSRLFVLRIPVEDDLAAYTVFETFNARGVELTASDLLKNYLMSLVARTGEADLDQVLSQWERIVKAVTPRRLPEFLRHYLNSIRKPYVRQERLFRTIRETTTNPEEVFVLLDALEASSIWYQALNDETDSLWATSQTAQDAVGQLRLFGVKQYRPLILAAARKLTDGKAANNQIGEVLRYCSLVSFRYNLIADKNTNDLEKVYNEVAADVHEGRLKQPAQVKEALRAVAVSDEEFREAFGRKTIPASGKGKRLVRYILVKLDRQLGHQVVSDNSPGITIEHILPENLTSVWEASFTPEQHERYVNRLGNYTLLTPSQNRDVAQKNITEKSAVYRTSEFRITQRLDLADWGPKEIEIRQREMAGWASSVWGY